MKKVLSIILSFAVLLSVFVFSGCGKDEVFEGDFKQVTLEELQTKFNEIGIRKTIDLESWKFSVSSSITWDKNSEYVNSSAMISNFFNKKEECNYLFNVKDDELIMQGEYVKEKECLSESQTSLNSSERCYYFYSNNTLYYKESGDEEKKEKISVTGKLGLLNVLKIYEISSVNVPSTGYSSLHDLFRDFVLDDADEVVEEEGYNLNFYICKTDKYIKLKVSATEQYEGENELEGCIAEGEFVMVYDAKNYDFIAGKVFNEIKYANRGCVEKVVMIMEPTNDVVELNEDFGSYVEIKSISDWKLYREM